MAVHGGNEDERARRAGVRNDDNWDKPRYVSRAAAMPLYTISRQSKKLPQNRGDSASIDSD